MTLAAELPFLSHARLYAGRTAVSDATGEFDYAELLAASERVAAGLLAGAGDLAEERVAFQLAPGFAWVATLWGIWRAGGVAVPLALAAVRAELEYALDDTAAGTVIHGPGTGDALQPLAQARGLRVLRWDELVGTGAGREARDREARGRELPDVDGNRRAMILFTSGTTSRPKGVVTTHANIAAQIACLIEAWQWTAHDRTLLCLPLHHVHGIINVVSCALSAGAWCEMLPRFDAEVVWERIASGKLTVFMAVPTIYVRLIAAWEQASRERQVELSRACAGLRLMVSGSAALPVSTLERWREISGHTLLERYGMTEIGMALSNPLDGERVPGSVGTPLPGVEVQLVGPDGAPASEGTPGEIEVRGPGVFLEYWGKPEATREAFRDGWFRTGDTAVVERGVYRILGRTSIDILKTGGHKVSALEIEEVLRRHPLVAECAVVGVPDAEWGERIGAAITTREGAALSLPELRAWAREHMAGHKLPTQLLVLESLPRNAIGKVTKPALTARMQQPADAPGGASA
jgi:malonyl-CoA/methylmalonyl-CoA synthetase